MYKNIFANKNELDKVATLYKSMQNNVTLFYVIFLL